MCFGGLERDRFSSTIKYTPLSGKTLHLSKVCLDCINAFLFSSAVIICSYLSAVEPSSIRGPENNAHACCRSWNCFYHEQGTIGYIFLYYTCINRISSMLCMYSDKLNPLVYSAWAADVLSSLCSF